MGRLTQLFSIAELKALDEKQLEILRDAVLHEMQTSPAIRRLLRAKTRRVYNQLKSKSRRRK
jgi:hypothetical protein